MTTHDWITLVVVLLFLFMAFVFSGSETALTASSRGTMLRLAKAGNPDAMAELRNILTAREALYARAEVHINTSKTTLERCLEGILDAIAKKRFVAV